MKDSSLSSESKEDNSSTESNNESMLAIEEWILKIFKENKRLRQSNELLCRLEKANSVEEINQGR